MGEQVEIPVVFKRGDTSGLDAAEKLQRTVAELRKEVDAAKRAGGLDAIAGDGRGLGRASAQIEEMTGDWRDLRREILKADEAVEKFSKEIKQIPDARGATAGVGGDISGRGETALTATAGLVSGLGGGALAEQLTVGADILGFADAMKQLKSQLTGVVPALGKMIGAKGMGGLAKVALKTGLALGAAGIAIGALAIVTKNLFDSWNKQAQELKSAIEASAEVTRAVAEGLTSEQARERIEALEKQLETEQKILEERQAAYDQFEEEAGDVGAALAKVFSPQEGALSDSLKESKTAVQGMSSEIKNYKEALDDGSLAANNAAAAEEKLAADRKKATAETIAAMQAASQTEIDRAGTLRSITVQGAKEQTAALQDQSFHQAALVTQLRNSAKAAGEGTEEFTQFSAAADKAGAELKATNSSLVFMQSAGAQAARANERAAQRTEELARAEEEAARQAEELAKSLQDFVQESRDALAELAETQRRESAARQQNARERHDDFLADMQTENESWYEGLQRRQADRARERKERRTSSRKSSSTRIADRKKTDDRLQRLTKDHERALADIRRKAKLDEFDLVASRDFAGLLRLRRDTKIREGEEKLSFKRRLDDLGVAIAGEQGIQSQLNQIRMAGGAEAARIVGSNTEAINKHIAQLFSGVLDRTRLEAPPPGRRTPEQAMAEIAARNARTRRQAAASGGFASNPQMQFRQPGGMQSLNQTTNNRTLNATNNFALPPGVNEEQITAIVMNALGRVIGQ